MYTIRILSGISKILVRDELQKAIEQGGKFSALLVVSTVDEEIRVQQVRLLEAKPYCGQHPGPCLLGGPKRKSRFLEWDDWVEFHSVVNGVLDSLKVRADVWSNPQDVRGKMWIRKGSRARVRFDYEESPTAFGVRIWNQGTDDQFERRIDVRPSIEELRGRYPFRQTYYGQGVHFVLIWWNYDAQYQLIVARSEKKVIETFKTISQMPRWDDAKPSKFYKVRMVSPTEDMLNQYALSCYRWDVSMFAGWYKHEVGRYQDKHKKLPPGVTKCSQYEGEAEFEPGEEIDHRSCNHCLDGFIHQGLTPDETYVNEKLQAKYQKDWKAPPIPTYQEKEHRRIRPPVADPHMPLFMAHNAGFNSGVKIYRLKSDLSLSRHDAPMFLFHGKNLPLPEELVRLEAARKARIRKEKAQRRKEQREARQREEERRDAEADELWESGT